MEGCIRAGRTLDFSKLRPPVLLLLCVQRGRYPLLDRRRPKRKPRRLQLRGAAPLRGEQQSVAHLAEDQPHRRLWHVEEGGPVERSCERSRELRVGRRRRRDDVHGPREARRRERVLDGPHRIPQLHPREGLRPSPPHVPAEAERKRQRELGCSAGVRKAGGAPTNPRAIPPLLTQHASVLGQHSPEARVHNANARRRSICARALPVPGHVCEEIMPGWAVFSQHPPAVRGTIVTNSGRADEHGWATLERSKGSRKVSGWRNAAVVNVPFLFVAPAAKEGKRAAARPYVVTSKVDNSIKPFEASRINPPRGRVPQ